VTQGVEDLQAIPNSLWNHYKKVISVRNKFNHIIEKATIVATNLDTRLYTLTYTYVRESITIITNVTGSDITIGNQEGWTLLEGIYPTLNRGTASANQLDVPAFSTLILA
jgi:hypothetical protein